MLLHITDKNFIYRAFLVRNLEIHISQVLSILRFFDPEHLLIEIYLKDKKVSTQKYMYWGIHQSIVYNSEKLGLYLVFQTRVWLATFEDIEKME